MSRAARQEIYRFEEFSLDIARGSLRSGDRSHELRPKSFEVLRYLVEHADRVVSKDELLAAVWPNVTVTEDSLTRCISEVRAALGDGEQRLIKTLPSLDAWLARDCILARYLEGWAEANPVKIFDATAAGYCFHDPLVGSFSRRGLPEYFERLQAQFVRG
jgi:hypothetical protein